MSELGAAGASLACRGAGSGANLSRQRRSCQGDCRGDRGGVGARERLECSPLRAEDAEARGARQGGLGGQETARSAMATRRSALGRGGVLEGFSSACRGCRGTRSAAGGPGRPGNGEECHGDTALCVGARERGRG